MLVVFGSRYTLPNHLKPHLQQNRNSDSRGAARYDLRSERLCARQEILNLLHSRSAWVVYSVKRDDQLVFRPN